MERILEKEAEERAKLGTSPLVLYRLAFEDIAAWTRSMGDGYSQREIDISDPRALIFDGNSKLIGLRDSKPIQLKLPHVYDFMVSRVGPDWEGDIETEGGPTRSFKSKAINTEIIMAYISYRVCSEIIEPGLQDLWGYASSLKQIPTFPKLLSSSGKSTTQNLKFTSSDIYVQIKPRKNGVSLRLKD